MGLSPADVPAGDTPRTSWLDTPVGELVGEVRRRGFAVAAGDDGPVIRPVVRAGHLPGPLVAAVRGRRDEVLAHVAGEGAGGTVRCDVCRRIWYCPADEFREYLGSPAICDRPARSYRQPWRAAADRQATPCPWKTT